MISTMTTHVVRPDRKAPRQIVGFSLTPELARAVKTEAARRGLSLRKLFEEMWAQYQETKQAKQGQ
jgi:hypothetical protein